MKPAAQADAEGISDGQKIQAGQVDIMFFSSVSSISALLLGA
jgi:hypothetical protein